MDPTEFFPHLNCATEPPVHMSAQHTRYAVAQWGAYALSSMTSNASSDGLAAMPILWPEGGNSFVEIVQHKSNLVNVRLVTGIASQDELRGNIICTADVTVAHQTIVTELAAEFADPKVGNLDAVAVRSRFVVEIEDVVDL